MGEALDFQGQGHFVRGHFVIQVGHGQLRPEFFNIRQDFRPTIGKGRRHRLEGFELILQIIGPDPRGHEHGRQRIRIEFLFIGPPFGGPFFGCPDVHVIKLIAHRFALEHPKEPRRGTKPQRFNH